MKTVKCLEVVILAALLGSCSRISNIPQSEYAAIDTLRQGSNNEYRVVLKDGRNFGATRIAVNDSTVTILAYSDLNKTIHGVLIPDSLPFTIRLDEVESLKQIEPAIVSTYIVYSLIVCAAACLTYYAIAIFGLGSGLSGD